MHFKIWLDGQHSYYPIQLAAIKGNVELVRLLLQNKSVIADVRDQDNVSAYWHAAFYGHTEVMTLLKPHVDVYV